jgi:endonuclease YncB( thermonuclease family)
MLKALTRTFLAALLLSIPQLAHAADITGKPRIIDGDTIEVAGERIRLHGIDAPESKQTCEWPGKTIPCGRLATLALMDLTAGSVVTCKTHEKDRYGRWVAICYDPDGFDLGRNMVHTGWALAYRRYSTDYVGTEDKARDAKRGMWKGEFVPPWDWRRGKRLASSTTPNDCRIKGNISRRSERIYHVPEGQYYDKTIIDTTKGERWFCSEDDARNAGWRRSLR